jgi:histidine triad (HIT) family protein
MADDCIFCKIIAGEIPSAKIYEDEQILAFLDIGPLSEGHCLVIPKEHYLRFEQLPDDLASALARQIAPVARAVVQAVHAEGYNVLNNNGRCAGQLVEHVHFHIIPRHSGDGVFTQWPSGKYLPGRMDELADMIKKLL